MNKRNIIYILLLLLIIIGFYINCYYEIENYEKETVSTKELSNKINTHEKILDKHTILLKIQDLRSELNLLKSEFQTKIENHQNSINNLNKILKVIMTHCVLFKIIFKIFRTNLTNIK